MKKLLYNITITSFCVIVLYLALDTHIYAQTMELMERSILLFNDGNPIKKAAISVSKNPVTIYNGAGFVTDTSIGIKHLEYIKPNTNEFWTENPFYSLSTNAPISVNGILGDNEIRSTKKIRSGTLIQKNLINVGPTIPAQRPLCAATNVNGNFIACTNTSINSIPPQNPVTVILTLDSDIIAANQFQATIVNWSSTGAKQCYAVDGPGFETGTKTSGSDETNLLYIKDGQRVTYSVLCRDEYGNSGFASATVTGKQTTLTVQLLIENQKEYYVDSVAPGISNTYSYSLTLSGTGLSGSCQKWATASPNANGPKPDLGWSGSSSFNSNLSAGGGYYKIYWAGSIGSNYGPGATHEGWRTYWIKCPTTVGVWVQDSFTLYAGN